MVLIDRAYLLGKINKNGETCFYRAMRKKYWNEFRSRGCRTPVHLISERICALGRALSARMQWVQGGCFFRVAVQFFLKIKILHHITLISWGHSQTLNNKFLLKERDFRGCGFISVRLEQSSQKDKATSRPLTVTESYRYQQIDRLPFVKSCFGNFSGDKLWY